MNKIKINDKLIIKISLVLLMFFFGILFFRSFSRVLTVEHLFTSNIVRVFLTILLPVIYYSFVLFIYTYLVIYIKKLYIIIIFPISFLVTQPIILTNILSALGILVAMFFLRRYILRNINRSSEPKIYSLFNNAYGISFFIIAIIISFSFYSVYSNLIYNLDLTSTNILTKKIELFTALTNNQNINNSANNTLLSYAKEVLTEEGKPTDPLSLQIKENTTLNTLGVSGTPNDSFNSLVDLAIVTQIKNFIQTSRQELAVFIPLAFYFVNQTFSQFSAYLTVALLWLSEMILKRMGIKIKFK